MEIPDGIYQSEIIHAMQFFVSGSKGIILEALFGEVSTIYEFSITGEEIAMIAIIGNGKNGIIYDRIKITTTPMPKLYMEKYGMFIYTSPLPHEMF